MRIITLAALLLGTSACYNAVPITVGSATPARDVEVHLTDRGTENVAAVVGPGTISIRGRPVTGPAADSLRVGVIQTTVRGGEERLWKRELVGIAHGDIGSLAEYRLSVPRTAAVVAAAVAGAFVTRLGVVGLRDTRRNRRPPTGQ